MNSKLIADAVAAGIPDLARIAPTVVDLSKLVPVYHTACWEIAFYFTRHLRPGEPITSDCVVLKDGKHPDPASQIICGSCGKGVRNDRGKILELSYEKPPEPQTAQKHKSGQKPEGYVKSAATPKHLRVVK